MTEMKDSGIEWIGEIPKEWDIGKTLYALSMPITDGPHETPELLLEGVPFVSAEAVSCGNGHIDFSHIRGYVSEDFYTECCKKYVPELHDIYMIKSGATTGRVAKVDTDKIFTIWSPLAVFRCDGNRCYYNYLYYFIQSDAYQKQIANKWTYGTQQNIGMRTLEKLIICFPPLPTQHRIADYLDDKCGKIDRYIEQQKQVIEKLKAYKQSVITEAVTKGLDPTVPMKDSGVEWIGEIPEGWEVRKFGRCVSIRSNLVSPEKYYDYPQISPDSIEKDTGKIVSYKTVKESGVISWNHYFKKNQIIYSKIRPLLNKVTIAPFDGLCSADMYPIETNNDSRFILYTILSIPFSSQVGLVTANRVKMPKINQSELSNIQIVLPPHDEQKTIANYLDKKCFSIDLAIEKKQTLIDKLTEYKKSLIYEVVTGKKEV